MSNDMTIDRVAALRKYLELTEAEGRYQVRLRVAEVRALLAAVEERDRLRKIVESTREVKNEKP